jgi:UDP-N-acetyl-D-mannosaminuronic acid transferase (WecB/TagA/CpsF family)
MPQVLGMNKPDGTLLGKASTSKIAFYGGTPAVRPTLAAAAATTECSTTSSNFGYTTSTQAMAILTLVNDIRAKLIALGLMA